MTDSTDYFQDANTRCIRCCWFFSSSFRVSQVYFFVVVFSPPLENMATEHGFPYSSKSDVNNHSMESNLVFVMGTMDPIYHTASPCVLKCKLEFERRRFFSGPGEEISIM